MMKYRVFQKVTLENLGYMIISVTSLSIAIPHKRYMWFLLRGDPFIDRYVSDGTMKMFAYLVLLHDPAPHQFLCIEEPENQLYPTLLHELAEEFRDYAQRGGQVFVSQ